jgi:hypothetical protein
LAKIESEGMGRVAAEGGVELLACVLLLLLLEPQPMKRARSATEVRRVRTVFMKSVSFPN